MKKLLVATALGAGLAYFLDPDHGPQRRGRIQQQFGGAKPAEPTVVPIIAVTTEPAAAAAR